MKSDRQSFCFVIPRYHVPKAGGAEILVEHLAERLAGIGHHVEVLTTCVQDHTKWRNDLTQGSEEINGVKVHRFRVDSRTNLNRFIQLEQRISRGWPLSRRDETAWMAGSVNSEALYQTLRAREGDWDGVIFAPYLFGITYRGIQIVPHKSYLIPCLHPESYAHLKIFHEMFRKPKGILFNSEPEKQLAKKLYGIEEERCAVVGMGFDEVPATSSSGFRDQYKIGSSPYMLYAGRRENGKNTPLLMDYFLTFIKHHPGLLKLVLVGSGDLPSKAIGHPDIMDLKFIPKVDLQYAYQEAVVACQPSINESFSIVLMESLLAGTPVLVNAKCDVTRDFVQRSCGGLWFKDYYEFEESVNLLLSDKDLRDRMAKQGKSYILKNFEWDIVLKRFLDAVSQRIQS